MLRLCVYIAITLQGVPYIQKHFPFAHINYERVEPSDQADCATKCTLFVNKAVEAIAKPLPSADPQTMVYQYNHTLQHSDPNEYWTTLLKDPRMRVMLKLIQIINVCWSYYSRR